jgi:Lamin Tail Domain
MRIHLSCLFLTFLITRSEGVIYISEVYPNPYGQEGVNGTVAGNPVEGREWFEITNPDPIPFVMNGYTIADNTANTNTVGRFRIGTYSIPAGGTVVFSGLSLASFNSTFGTNLNASQYFEIPSTPTWSSAGGTSGMNNTGWLNNTSGDNIRIFTDVGATVELTGNYRPITNFPTTINGQSFYWDGVSGTSWILNSTADPTGFEGDDLAQPFFASPGTVGAAVPEANSIVILALGSLLALRREKAIRDLEFSYANQSCG